MPKLKSFWDTYAEIIGDLLVILFGCLLLYIFVIIEILGAYGHEPNKYIRWAEITMGVPIVILGINRLIQDIKEIK